MGHAQPDHSPFASEEAFLSRCAADFEFFCLHCLKIRTLTRDKKYTVQPLMLTDEQRAVANYVTFCLKGGHDVRIIIDKCRKLGMSTVVEAIGYWLCYFKPNFRALVIAHTSKATQKIALINKGFNRMLPDPMREGGAKEAYNNLNWPADWGSMFECLTQGTENATRGGDASFVHLSELAFWDADRRSTSAEDALTAILGDNPWAAIVESTANGATGAFYGRFTSSWREWFDPTVTRKIWKPFFFTWRGVGKYTVGVPDDIELMHDRLVLEHKKGRAQKAEKLAQKLQYGAEWYQRSIDYGLSAGQVAWAQSKVRDFNGDLRKFDQEYPLTWEMSFLSSGRPVFDPEVMGRWIQEQIPADTRMFDRLADDQGAGQGAGDEWHIYEPPEFGEEYIVGTDSAEGNDGGDFSVAKVFARRSKRIVAEFYGVADPSELGEQAVMVARWYRDAFIIPEIDNHGYATVRRMLDLGYRSIQRRKPGKSVRAGTPWSQIYGWKSTEQNRRRTIGQMRTAVKQEAYWETSPRTRSEMLMYCFDGRGRPDHLPGQHDDGITTTRLILEADRTLRAPKELTEVVEAPKSAIERARARMRREAMGGKGKRKGKSRVAQS